MELTDVYRRAPGCCSVCNTSATVNGVIDLGIDDMSRPHRSFSVYLCGECALQIGTMIAPRFGKQLLPEDVGHRLVAVTNETVELRERLEHANHIFDQIRQVPR